jgi:hypothetical protein
MANYRIARVVSIAVPKMMRIVLRACSLRAGNAGELAHDELKAALCLGLLLTLRWRESDSNRRSRRHSATHF